MQLRSLLIGFSLASLALWIPGATFAADAPSASQHLAADAQEPSEHPEHPEKAKDGKEHPEHPEKKGSASIESVAKFLEEQVGQETKKQGGWWKIRDTKAGMDLELRLDKIHRERLAKTDKETYFVCADFSTASGKVYDLDFWVKETEEGLMIAETTIHKEEGKARYSWSEKDGVWSQVKKP